MAETILMTALSPTMEEGSIVTWQMSEGDKIASGDVICEVETDKATMDYESTQEGTLLKIVRDEGSSAKVGDVIAILGESGEDFGDLLKEAQAQTVAPQAVVTSSGAAAPPAGAAAAPVAGSAQSAVSSDGSSGTSAQGSSGAPAQSGGEVKSSPLARKLAAELSVDISQVPGTGPGGRVVKRDVEGFSGGTTGGGPAVAASAVSAGYVASPLQAGTDISIPVAGKRAVIANRLSESMFSAPHYYLKSSVQMDGAINARSQLNSEIPEKASFNAFLIKYVAEAIKRHPQVNASWQGDHITQFGSIDIGLAVDLGTGLITPIVRNCGNKGVVAIDQELKALIAKTAEGKLQPEEYTGATFTISNLGSFGVEEFTAVINPPGSAILAVGQISKTVIVGDDDELSVAQIVKMTLSCDHRVIDGATGGRFLHDLKRIIENPVRALY